MQFFTEITEILMLIYISGLHRSHTTSLDDIIVNILNSESHVSVVFMTSPKDILSAKKARGPVAEDLFFILGNYVLDLDTVNTKGVLIVMPDIMPVMAFDDYFENKTLNNDMGSWFHSYYKASITNIIFTVVVWVK